MQLGAPSCRRSRTLGVAPATASVAVRRQRGVLAHEPMWVYVLFAARARKSAEGVSV